MDPSNRELNRLLDDAEAAYGRVRVEIIDRIASPARIDISQLDPRQRWALHELDRAEGALHSYRDRCYA